MGKHDNHENKKSKKGIKILFSIVLLIIVGIGAFLGWKYMNGKKTIEVNTNVTNEATEGLPVEEPEKEIKIFSGVDRPIACMIDNHSDAWPQFSINKAYLVYEIIVEGGETRLMALFKGSDADKVGPMRSSRHYFLDYALENDAIYAHIGWSPQAQADIKTLGINNVNGLAYDTGKAWKEGDVFWRISGKYKAPHNSICDLATVKAKAAELGYSTTSTKKSVLNYVADPVTLDDKADCQNATNVVIPFSFERAHPFKEGMAVVRKDGKYGYVDKKGNQVTDYIYDDATEQNEYGYSGIKKDGLWGVIDQKGNIVLEPKYNLDKNIIVNFIGKWHISEDLNANYYTDN